MNKSRSYIFLTFTFWHLHLRMPLYREWSSDSYSLAAIWEIQEPESFFVERTQLHPAIKNEKRRMEHLAGRFLLRHLKHDFPLLDIQPDKHDKPRIKDNQYYFSISHSYPYVAAVVSPYVECGMDIQVWHPRMERLQHKFLSAAEQEFFKEDPRMLTAAWCTKEAAYKWQGRRGVEFIDHLIIQNIISHSTHYDMDIRLELTSSKMRIMSEAFVDNDFACAVISNKEIVHPEF